MIEILDCEISGGIDAHGAIIEGDLQLNDCRVSGGLRLSEARIRGHFRAERAVFRSTRGAAIAAEGMCAAGWCMDNAQVNGRFDMNGAELSGQFNANRAVFENPGGDAIWAQSVRAGGWFMDGARVNGRFDLNSARIDGQFNASGARFENRGGCAVRAQEVEAAGWFMGNSTINGELDLNNAEIRSQVNLSGSKLRHARKNAVQAFNVRASSWIMTGAGVTGRFNINGAVIPGRFNADKAIFTNRGGDALSAFNARVGDWHMREATVSGVFDLHGAVIERQFNANGETAFLNAGGDAIVAIGAHAGGWLMKGVTVAGRLNLNGAVIDGEFNANELVLTDAQSDAINAEGVKAAGWQMRGAKIRGRIILNSATISRKFDVTGARLSAARREEALAAAYAIFGGGIFADNTEMVGEIHLACSEIRKTLRIQDSRIEGSFNRAVCLREAAVLGETSFRGSRFYGHIHANRATFEGRLSFRRATFVAASFARARGLIDRHSEKPSGAIEQERQERFRHHAIVLHEARIAGRLVMPSERPDGIIDLSRASCDTLEDFSDGWAPHLERGKSGHPERTEALGPDLSPVDIRHIVLDGFEYRHFEFPSGAANGNKDVAEARGHWLCGQPEGDLRTHFNPQPWRQAATVLRAMGYDEAAQKISIERRVRQRLADDMPVFNRLISRLLHFFADYGFNPWKTVCWSGISVVLCAAFYWTAGLYCAANSHCAADGAYLRVLAGDVDQNQPYPAFDPLVYSLDRFLPIPDLGMESYWRPNTKAELTYRRPDDAGRETREPDRKLKIGWLIYVVSMLEAFLGAILVAIAITGFTGLLTRDEK